jgi:hypothetical protein
MKHERVLYCAWSNIGLLYRLDSKLSTHVTYPMRIIYLRKNFTYPFKLLLNWLSKHLFGTNPSPQTHTHKTTKKIANVPQASKKTKNNPIKFLIKQKFPYKFKKEKKKCNFLNFFKNDFYFYKKIKLNLETLVFWFSFFLFIIFLKFIKSIFVIDNF